MSSVPVMDSPLAGGDARVLITGGAGFIGAHLANVLVESGVRVRVIDALCEQVHGENPGFPPYLHREVERIEADVRDRDALDLALRGVTHVCHLAAAVGVGQSMYEIERYIDINTRGTAVLLEALVRRPVQQLVVASSMSVYGEGLYRRGEKFVEVPLRELARLRQGRWEIDDARPVPTPETKTVVPASVYALSKYDQEQLCLIFGKAYRIPTVALRLFNVYGPHQSLSNPYTGVLAIFASRILNGSAPLIFEDGLQRRDFVSVWDIVQAFVRALTTEHHGEVFNIGSGEPQTILEIAQRAIAVMGADLEPAVTGKYRVGDIRHCFADIDKARRLLGYEPRVRFADGLLELAQWLETAHAEDNFATASEELDRRGLTL